MDRYPGHKANDSDLAAFDHYGHKNGFFEVSKIFSTEFIPEVERLLPGLSKEQIQPQIDFYKEGYKQ